MSSVCKQRKCLFFSLLLLLIVTLHLLETLHESTSSLIQYDTAFQVPNTVVTSNSSSLTTHPNSDKTTPRPPPSSIGSCSDLTWHISKSSAQRVIWVASFPGSGAEMFRHLISHLTGGLPAWSTYVKDNPIPNTTCVEAKAATCKTHWPVLDYQPLSWTESRYHSQVIVLLRNPTTAFPSRFNHQWELQHNIGYHVQQAPERAWNSYIKRTFGHQQENFHDFVTTWATMKAVNSNKKAVALFVPYEGLIDPIQGPMWTRRILQVLHQAGTHQIIADHTTTSYSLSSNTIDCLWKDAILDRPTKKRAPHTYRPGYQPKHQLKFQQLLQDIITNITSNNQSYDSDLLSILKAYQRLIQNNESIRILY